MGQTLGTHTTLPLAVVMKRIMRVVYMGQISDNLLCWEKLNCVLDRTHRMSMAVVPEQIRFTYPSEIQGHYEDEMGGEYDQEISRRILYDGSQNTWNLWSHLP